MAVTGRAPDDAAAASTRSPRSRDLISFALGAVLGLMLARSAPAQTPAYDLVLRNGRIVDGTGSPWHRADLAIRGDTIVHIAPSIPDRATRVIDVGGRVITPGFIDVHTHAGRGIFDVPTADNYVRQGVTTVMEGGDGSFGADWALPGEARGTAEIAQHGDLCRAGIGPRGRRRRGQSAADGR